MMNSAPEFQKKSFSIAIVGGGLGGLAVAFGLLHHNVPCHIYEAAAEFSEIGAGLAFGPNAFKAMELLSPKVFAAYNACATYNESPDWYRTVFGFRYGMDSRNGNGRKYPEIIQRVDFPVSNRDDRARSCVHRARFLDELVKLVPPETVTFKKALVDIKETDGGVTLNFADGTTATASAAIGCDGIKSTARKCVLGYQDPAASAVFAGEYAYRSVVPRDVARSVLGPEQAGNMNIYLGYIVTYPIDHGKLMNVVAIPRKSDGVWDGEQWVVPATKDKLLKDFEGWDERLISLLKRIEKPEMWGLHDQPPTKTYYRGRMCILGDAAHASTPNLGAGTGMAMEDAYILSNVLGDVRSADDIAKAFRAYDAIQRPRSQALVAISREAGQLYDFVYPGVGDDLEKVQETIGENFRWLWEVDLPGRMREAKELMANYT